MSRPRVVIVANSIDELGGAQRVVHLVARGLAERGYPVELVGLTPAPHPHEYRPPGESITPYRTITLMPRSWPAPPRDNRLTTRLRPSVRRLIAERARLSTQATAALRRLLTDGPTGVLVVAQLWAMEHVPRDVLDGWPVIAQYHSSYEAAADGRDLARVLREYADADLFALLTQADADAFRRVGLDNTIDLPNPLGVWPPEPVDAADGRTVTFLGRFSAEKGPRFLVDAWARVAVAHPDWRLRLVGSGPDEGALRRQVERLAAGSDRVDFVPPVADVRGELARTGVLALPSLTEGLPMALAEAMAFGLACVATDCSAGVRLLTDDGRAGVLVPRADSGALADALDGLLADPGRRRRLGRAAREQVEPLRAPRVLDRWEQLIATALR